MNKMKTSPFRMLRRSVVGLFKEYEGVHFLCLHKVTDKPFVSLRKHKLFTICVKSYAGK